MREGTKRSRKVERLLGREGRGRLSEVEMDEGFTVGRGGGMQRGKEAKNARGRVREIAGGKVPDTATGREMARMRMSQGGPASERSDLCTLSARFRSLG